MGNELNHIGFILDGNRRWARAQGLPTIEGHRKGYDLVKDVADWCLDRGVTQMSAWAFSTENWKRSKEEVGYLMDLALRLLTKDLEEFAKRNIRLRVLGRREDLSEKLQSAIDKAESTTAHNTRGQFNLCFNYGGHVEILEGVKRCLQEGIDSNGLTEELFASKLWTVDTMDVDLIIRTSGEHRTSGFLSWTGAYAELFFSELMWPEFSQDELDRAIEWFKGRRRRYGA